MNDDPFDSSRARSLIEGWYPSPIARAFARAIARPEDAGASTRLASVTIQFLALVALRDLLARPDDWAEETPAELERLRRPLTDGAWLGLLRHALGRGKARAFDPELATTFLERGLDARLGEVVSLRNRIVHDNTQDALPELKRALARALGDLSSLRSLRFVVPREQVSGSEGEIAQYRATLYRGFASPFPTVLLRTEARLEAGRPYLARSGSEEVLALYPCFIEAAGLAGAGERDLFLLSHREKQRVVAAGTDATELDAKVARDADLALEQLVKRTAKRTGRTTVKRFEVGGDALVARRRLAAGDSVDRYRVVRFIASGGMADVYEVEDAGGRPAALKMLSIELARSDETLRRFIAEVSRARSLGHPNVVRYVDHGDTEGDHWLVLELASGWPTGEGEPARDLARLIRSRRARGEPVPEAVVLGVALDVAQGLQAIHEKGIVHRDLKPANVLLFSEGSARRAKVADFGVSRERAGETLTLTGFSVGTPEYMAPEQAEGRAHGTETEHSVDLYALGVVLYELASGDVPFRGATPLETAHLHVKRKPEGLKQRAPGVSAGLARIVMKLLRKDPKTRYRSAADLYRDLRQLEAEPGSDPRAARRRRSGSAPASASAAIAWARRSRATPRRSSSRRRTRERARPCAWACSRRASRRRPSRGASPSSGSRRPLASGTRRSSRSARSSPRRGTRTSSPTRPRGSRSPSSGPCRSRPRSASSSRSRAASTSSRRASRTAASRPRTSGSTPARAPTPNARTPSSTSPWGARSSGGSPSSRRRLPRRGMRPAGWTRSA